MCRTQGGDVLDLTQVWQQAGLGVDQLGIDLNKWVTCISRGYLQSTYPPYLGGCTPPPASSPPAGPRRRTGWSGRPRSGPRRWATLPLMTSPSPRVVCELKIILERDDPPKPCLVHSTINSPQCQEDFLCSAHLLESFEGRIYTYGSVLKSKFVPQRTQEDGLYRKNPSNHELLTLRGVDRRVCLIRVGGVIPP